MRLIDADARVTVQSFDPMNEEYNHDEMTIERALDFATDEGCPPTIDAIPMEWIRNKRDEIIKPRYGKQAATTITRLLVMWKEQEAR